MLINREASNIANLIDTITDTHHEYRHYIPLLRDPHQRDELITYLEQQPHQEAITTTLRNQIMQFAISKSIGLPISSITPQIIEDTMNVL